MDNTIYAKKLEEKSIRPTAIRLLVMGAMGAAARPVSIPDLECVLETVDKSSIFRTLNLFLAHRLIHSFEDGSGVLKYELCDTSEEGSVADMHTHFYCEHCHRTFCFKAIHIPVIDLPDGFSMTGINYMVKGICRECSAKPGDGKRT